MLVLSREAGERIFIGKKAEIQITVVRMGGGQVQLAITAPSEVPIHREEVYHKIYRSDDVGDGSEE